LKFDVKVMERRERELGRKRLMLRFPELRDVLRNAEGPEIEELFGSYQLAVSVHERVTKTAEAPKEWLASYAKIYLDIEDAVRAYFQR
jgi:hypothetical protein